MNYKENLFQFPPPNQLVGICSEPQTRDPQRPAVIFLNSGIIHRVGVNRLHVKLSRTLAAKGFLAARFDLSGLGDSPSRTDGLPYQQSRFRETKAVMDHLSASYGIKEFILFGLCSGADHAFRMSGQDKRVKGFILLDGYAYKTPGHIVRHLSSRLLKLQIWKNLFSGKYQLTKKLLTTKSKESSAAKTTFAMDIPPKTEAENSLNELDQRNTKMLWLYTSSAAPVFNHQKQFAEMFPRLKNSGNLQVEYWPEVNHTFTLISDQARLETLVLEWATKLWPDKQLTQEEAR